MAQQTIFSDSQRPFGGPNGGNSTEFGDTWDVTAAKINAMFAELYDAIAITPGSGLELVAGTLSITPAGVTNAMLQNPSIILGSTNMVLGNTYSTIAGNLTLSGTVNFSGSFEIGGTPVTLPVSVANGGTGAASLTANGVLYGGGTGAIGASAVNSTATNKFLTQANGFAPGWTTIQSGDIPTPLALNPAAASTTQGFVVSQSAPASPGTQSTTLNFNSITVLDNTGYTVTGQTFDSWGLLTMESALRVNFAKSGQGAGNQNAFCAVARMDGPADVYGAALAAYSNQNAPSNWIWGEIPFSHAGASANIEASVCSDAESLVESGAVVQFRSSFMATSQRYGALATGLDAAVIVRTANGGLVGTPLPFGNGIVFTSNAPSAGQPVDAAGSIFVADGTWTVDTLWKAPNLTCTTDIFNIKNFHVNGAGTFLTPIAQTINSNSTVAMTVNNNSTGSSAYSAFVANNSANNAAFGIGSTGATPTIQQNRSFINASSGSAGIAINNRGANPTVFGISDAEIGRWDSATPGQLDLGLAGTTVGKLLFNNATSGSIILQPTTGALGSSVQTLQAVTDTFVYRATTDTLTNKTLSSSTNVLGGVTMTLGSDANGDIYYRNSSGILTRLGIGSANQFLAGSGSIPAWAQAAMANISDYATGTWSPTVTTDGTVGTPAYSSQVGSFEKIGRLVIARFTVALSGWTGSPTGNVAISGLPFTAANTTNDNGTCSIFQWSTTTALIFLSGFVAPNTTQANLNASTAAVTTMSRLTAAQSGATPTFIGVAIYHT